MDAAEYGWSLQPSLTMCKQLWLVWILAALEDKIR
jgi:hypothetical protein